MKRRSALRRVVGAAITVSVCGLFQAGPVAALPTPVSAPALRGAVAVQAAPGDPDSSVISWGTVRAPVEISRVIGFTSEAALQDDGVVIPLGRGAPLEVVPGLEGVAGLGPNGMAVRNNGSVTTWYGPDSKALRRLNNVASVAGNTTVGLALRRDGKVEAWGRYYRNSGLRPAVQVPPGLHDVAAIAAADYAQLALLQDGSIAAWGFIDDKAVTVPTGLRNVTAIATGGTHNLALRRDGTVVEWRGGASTASDRTVSWLSGVKAIAAIPNVSVALKEDNTVVVWGPDFEGGPRTVISNVAAIAADGYAAMARRSDGTFARLHINRVTDRVENIPGRLAGVRSVAVGTRHSVALRHDGTVVTWGDPGANAQPALTNVTAVAASTDISLALKSDGTVVQWGYGKVPAGVGDVVAISANGARAARTYDLWWNALALRSDGTVVQWGGDGYELPNRTTTVTPPPAGLTDLTAIAQGGRALGLRRDGTVVVWSGSLLSEGPYAAPAGLSGVTAIAAGDHHYLALRNDGTVVAWGNPGSGTEAVVPTGLRDVIAIAAGDRHSVALKSDGTVVSWGASNSGGTATPTGLRGVSAIAADGDNTIAVTSMPSPTIPTKVSRRGSPGGVRLEWSTPIYGGSHGIDGYSITATSGDVLASLPATARRFSLANLPIDSGFTVSVAAVGGGVPGPAASLTVRTDDIAVFRPSNGTWYRRTLPPVRFGQRGDVPVPGDYDGDGRTDIAVYRPSTSTWHIRGMRTIKFGRRGNTPVPADYNRDGVTDLAVFDGDVWLFPDGSSSHIGATPDVPLRVGFPSVFRPRTGQWFYLLDTRISFGRPGDVPLPEDYDGEGELDIAVYRPRTGTWHVRGTATVAFGQQADLPVPADYDADGVTDIAVFRPSTGTWRIRGRGTIRFGRPGDIPIPPQRGFSPSVW